MMANLISIIILSCLLGVVFGENHWALLVAGSNGYDNYRHQADICHSYHVLHNHGIPDERIVVMMYDDIAQNSGNPFPGNIINQPNGPNVYPGVPKDYTGDEVTPDVFLKVLTGDAEGVKQLLGRDGKVIKSGPEDRIFVNFADHGAPGILAFPEDFLHAEDLNNAINKMYLAKQYKQMVFYIEACESGSMFAKLLKKNINVFATTASNPHESSYACYFDSERETYLGDVYSVMWMQDSDKENLEVETLQSQFKIVKEETNTSHVMEYGDLKMGILKVADFQGNLTGMPLRFVPRLPYHPTVDAVPSEDVKQEIFKRKIAKATGAEQVKLQAQLDALYKSKEDVTQFFRNVVSSVSGFHMFEVFLRSPVSFTDFSCYKESLDLLRKLCPGMRLPQNDYALRKLRVLANMCEADIPQQKIWASIGKVAYETPFCAIDA